MHQHYLYNLFIIAFHSEKIMRWATNIARKQLLSFGMCIGKFTHGGNFHLVITALNVIAPYAKVSLLIQVIMFFLPNVY